jgi:hypothetical protein
MRPCASYIRCPENIGVRCEAKPVNGFSLPRRNDVASADDEPLWFTCSISMYFPLEIAAAFLIFPNMLTDLPSGS